MGQAKPILRPAGYGGQANSNDQNSKGATTKTRTDTNYGARRENRVYKYMHIYLCTILTIRFLEVSPVRRAAGKGGVQGAQSI